MTGRSVAEVLALTPAEYQGWRLHVSRYPPVEFILAAIWATLGGDPEHMGYWLESPAMKREREAAEEASAAEARDRRVREALGVDESAKTPE